METPGDLETFRAIGVFELESLQRLSAQVHQLHCLNLLIVSTWYGQFLLGQGYEKDKANLWIGDADEHAVL